MWGNPHNLFAGIPPSTSIQSRDRCHPASLATRRLLAPKLVLNLPGFFGGKKLPDGLFSVQKFEKGLRFPEHLFLS